TSWRPGLRATAETVSVHEVPARPGVVLLVGPPGQWDASTHLRGEFRDLDTGRLAEPPVLEPIIPIPSKFDPPQVRLAENTPHMITFENGTVRVSDLRRAHLLSALGRTSCEQYPDLLGQLTAALPEYPNDP